MIKESEFDPSTELDFSSWSLCTKDQKQTRYQNWNLLEKSCELQPPVVSDFL